MIDNTLILNAIKISLFISLTGITISFLIAFTSYFLLKKFSQRLRIFIETLISLPIFLSPAVVGYLLLIILGKKGPIGSLIQELFKYKILFSKNAAIIVFIVVSVPILYQNIKTALNSIDKSYLEAARVMGASELDIIFHILLPLGKRGILAGITLGFGRGFGEFGATIMVAGNIPSKTQTIPLAIYSLAEAGRDSEANILVIFVFIFCSLMFFLYSKLTDKKKS